MQHYWPIHTQSVDIPVINNYDSYNKYSIKINLIRAEGLVDSQKQMWDPSGYDDRSQLSHSPPSEGGEESDHQCDHILHLPYCQKCINHCSGSASSACPCPRKQTCVNNVFRSELSDAPITPSRDDVSLLALQRNDLISQDQKTLSELKFNLDHLGSNVKKNVQTLIDKYDDVWARESRLAGFSRVKN